MEKMSKFINNYRFTLTTVWEVGGFMNHCEMSTQAFNVTQN